MADHLITDTGMETAPNADTGLKAGKDRFDLALLGPCQSALREVMEVATATARSETSGE